MARKISGNTLKAKNWLSVFRYLLIITFVFVVVQIVLISIFDFNLVEWRYYPIAQVGTTVAVPPNEFNQLAQQLQEKEIDLSEREEALKKQEATLELERLNVLNDKGNTLYYLYVISSLLIVLIVVNYYLDYRRQKGKM